MSGPARPVRHPVSGWVRLVPPGAVGPARNRDRSVIAARPRRGAALLGSSLSREPQEGRHARRMCEQTREQRRQRRQTPGRERGRTSIRHPGASARRLGTDGGGPRGLRADPDRLDPPAPGAPRNCASRTTSSRTRSSRAAPPWPATPSAPSATACAPPPPAPPAAPRSWSRPSTRTPRRAHRGTVNGRATSPFPTPPVAPDPGASPGHVLPGPPRRRADCPL